MDKDKIIQQGTVAKWLIKIDRPDFDMRTDDFSVTLSGGISPAWSRHLDKGSMSHEPAGYFVVLDTAGLNGQVVAECRFSVADDVGNRRAIVDRQVIGFVVDGPCPRFMNCKCATEAGVTYTIVRQEGYKVLFGAGQEWTDATQTAIVQNSAAGTYEVHAESNESYVFLLVPSFMAIDGASLSGFLFPLQQPIGVMVDGVQYLCYQSANTYDAGILRVVIA